MATIKIEVYRDGAEWFAARTIDGEYDGCDSLEIDDGSSDAEAIAAAQAMPLTQRRLGRDTPLTGERIITRVGDVDSANGRFPS